MAGNRTRIRGRQLALLPTDGGVNPGDPLVVGQLPGISLNGGGLAVQAIDTLGVYNLSVRAVDDAGNNAIAVGDMLAYVVGDTPKLSKKSFNPGGGTNKIPVTLTSVQSPASVAANTTVEQSLVIASGLQATDFAVAVSKPTEQAGLAVGEARVIDATHIGVEFINDTAAPIVPTAGETYTFTVLRQGTAAGAASGVRFGIALNAVAGGVTANIDVRLGY